MPIMAGGTAYLPFRLYTTPGVPVQAANKAALVAAGWSMGVWIGGVNVGSPVWDLVVINESIGEYEIKYTTQIGHGEIRPIGPAGSLSSPDGYVLDVETNDLDSIASLLPPVAGTQVTWGTSLSNWGAVEEGDVWTSPPMTVNAAQLEWNLGVTSLVGVTVEAALKSQPTDTPIDITAEAMNPGVNLNVQASWSTFPVAMALGALFTKTWYCDIQLIFNGLIWTPFRGQIVVNWQSDTRTS